MSTAKFNGNQSDIDFEKMVHLGNRVDIEANLNRLSPVQKARVIMMLKADDKARLVEILDPEPFAKMLTKMSGLGAATILHQLPHEMAANRVVAS